MEESMEKLLKELLQKKLHGTLTAEEEVVLNDLVMRRHGGGHLASPKPSFTGNAGFDNFMTGLDALNSDFEEMADKLRKQSSAAESRHTIARKDK